VASAEMDAFATEEHVGHRALWELKRAELLEGLVAVVEAGPEARPVELERRFGFEDPDSWPPLRLGEVHVRGIVDRIDRLPDGSLLVIDYKSSRIDSLNPRLKPEGLLAPEFQLPLYAAMLRQREPSARVDAAYFSLKDARRTKTLRENGVDLEALPLAGAVQDRVERMRAGRFPVRPLSCEGESARAWTCWRNAKPPGGASAAISAWRRSGPSTRSAARSCAGTQRPRGSIRASASSTKRRRAGSCARLARPLPCARWKAPSARACRAGPGASAPRWGCGRRASSAPVSRTRWRRCCRSSARRALRPCSSCPTPGPPSTTMPGPAVSSIGQRRVCAPLSSPPEERRHPRPV